MSVFACRKTPYLTGSANGGHFTMQFTHGRLTCITANEIDHEVMKVDAYDVDNKPQPINIHEPILTDMRNNHRNVASCYLLDDNTLVQTFKPAVTFQNKRNIHTLYFHTLLILKGDTHGCQYKFNFINEKLVGILINDHCYDVEEANAFDINDNMEKIIFDNNEKRTQLKNFLANIWNVQMTQGIFAIISRDPMVIGQMNLVVGINFVLRRVGNNSFILQEARSSGMENGLGPLG